MSDDELFNIYFQDDKTIIASLRDVYEQGIADAIDEIKSIIKNYHAHIDDDAMADIFSDLEHLKEQKNE